MRINPYLLHVPLEPLAGLGDDEEEVRKYSMICSDDELTIRELIRELIVPHVAALKGSLQVNIKNSYKYYLSSPASDFGRVFYSMLPPFDAPCNPRDFFCWVWDECFPGESVVLDSCNEVVIDPDINERLHY